MGDTALPSHFRASAPEGRDGDTSVHTRRNRPVVGVAVGAGCYTRREAICFSSDVFLIANTRGLARKIAKIKKPRASDDAFAHDFDLLDARRMAQENALDTDAEAHLAHGEGAARTRPVPFDDNPLEHLRTFLVAFDDAIVNPHAVADAKIRKVRSEKGSFEVSEFG